MKIFQCDSGREFNPTLFIQHFEQCSIQRQLLCPYTSEQNSVADRKHKHIVETTLTMLFHALLPLYFSVDAFLIVVLSY